MHTARVSARYKAVANYIDNQTDEGWQELLKTIMTELGGVQVTLADKFDDHDLSKSLQEVTLSVVADGRSWLFVRAEGYGEFDAADGHGDLLCLEVYESELRLIRSTGINSPDIEVVSLESLREDHRQDDGTNGQDRESYSDDQDRQSYSVG